MLLRVHIVLYCMSVCNIKIPTVQLMSKLTARIDQNAYLARFFARHKELHAFDARVSRLLTRATMLASYAARDLYVYTNTHS